MTRIEECKIYVTVGNGQKMKCDLKVKVKIKLQGIETVKLTEALYIPQAVKNIFCIQACIKKIHDGGY